MIILKIIGILLLIIIAIVIILLCVPLCIGVTYDNTITVIIKYLFIRYEYCSEKSKNTQSDISKRPSLWQKIKIAIKRGFTAVKSMLSKIFSSLKALWHRFKRKVKAYFKPKHSSRRRKASGGKKSSKTTSSDENIFQSLIRERGFWGAIEFFADIGKMLGGAMVKIFRGVAANRFVLHAEISGADAADTAIKYGQICSFAFPALSFLLSNMRRYSQDIVITPNFEGEKDKIYFDGMFVVFPIAVLGHALAAGLKFFIKQIKISMKK